MGIESSRKEGGGLVLGDQGGAGDDLLEGGAGADQILGGDGYDIASYAHASTGVTVSLDGSVTATGDAAGDVLTQIEGLEGSAFADTLVGDAGANELRGLAGNDTLKGGLGSDLYDWSLGDGADTIIDTGGTMVKAAEALRSKGATGIFACCTHAVLSGPAVERITESQIEELIVTDTIELQGAAARCGKIRVLSVAGLLGEAIERIHNADSVSSLFV